MKLYPPIIEGIIPAFCNKTLIVPFTMNKSVSESEIYSFKLKLQTVQSGYQPFLVDTIKFDHWDKDTNEVYFTLPDVLEIGSFYKIQMAYTKIVNKEEIVGYYSTVGVVKYTSEPTVTILPPKNGNLYTGIYSQKSSNNTEIKDYSEKVYSYEFVLRDAYNNILESSGEQLHDSSKDIYLYESIDSYTLKTDLEQDKIYYLDYKIKTINGLTRSAQSQHIYQIGSIDSKLHTKLSCKLDYENGYIDVSLTKPDGVEIEEPAVGSFYLLRASDEDNFGSWHEVLKFVLQGQQPSRHLWKDMTIKQGVKYKYAVQQFNEHQLRSNKIESEIIEADFEHAFLYDGERQLKIKYNPKISSFKTTLLESKIDTIGSKHPFIFRNGSVNYKEFPISGLISYLSDENDLFYVTSNNFNERDLYRLETVNNDLVQVVLKDGWITELVYQKNKDKYYCKMGISNYIPWVEYLQKKYPHIDPNNYNIDLQRILSDVITNLKILYCREKIEHNIHTRNTNLTSDNIYLERNFKLEVLEWLNNGKPKIFRSPTEGNYIVRLMNVSLSPTDSLNRMIHTFSCTAYEIAENNQSNLENYNFVKANVEIEKSLRWLSVDLSAKNIESDKNLLDFNASAIYLEDLLPGDKISITTLDENSKKSNTYSVMIGATGRYIIDLKNNVLITNVSFKDVNIDKPIYHQGLLTYAYYSNDFQDSFDTINSIDTIMVPCQQFIGRYDNIIEEIETVKDKIDSIGFIRFSLRSDDIEVYRFNQTYYNSKSLIDSDNSIDLVDLTNIYKVNIYDCVEMVSNIENENDYEQNKNSYWYIESRDKKYIHLNEYVETTIKNQNYEKDRYKELIEPLLKTALANQQIYYDIKTYIGSEWFDGYNGYVLDPEDMTNTQIIIDESDEGSIDIKNTTYYELRAAADVKSIKTGAAIITEICYSKKFIGYDLEEKDDLCKEKKKIYTDALNELKDAIKNINTDRSTLKEKQDACITTYKDYTDTLEEAVLAAERR